MPSSKLVNSYHSSFYNNYAIQYMKKLLFALLLAPLTIPAAKAQDDPKAPKFEFVGGVNRDYGTVTEGSSTTNIFKFKNTGKSPLMIKNAKGSCGCTVPKFSDKPVLPGKTGELEVTYNATAGPGAFEKTVFIESNVPGGQYELHIKGMVKKK